MKKLAAIIIAIPLLLSGCGGDETDDNDITNSSLGLYETEEFSILGPLDWEVIEAAKFPSNVPSELVVGFQNNIINEEFTSNVNVNKSVLDQPISAQDFGKNSQRKIKDTLVSYQELSSGEISLEGEEKTLVGYKVEFQGKRSASSSIIHFKQLYVSQENVVFTVTASYPLTEDESIVKLIDEMLNSFRPK